VLRRPVLHAARDGLQLPRPTGLHRLPIWRAPVLRRPERQPAPAVFAVPARGWQLRQRPVALPGYAALRRWLLAVLVGVVPADVVHRRPAILDPVLLAA